MEDGIERSNVVKFPVSPILCSNCEHAMMGNSYGLYCGFYREDIWQDASAVECEEFNPVPWMWKKQDGK